MIDSSLNERAIIDKALVGDQSAYRYLLEKYKAFAFTIALRIVKNSEDAEEIVQDAFIKAFKSMAQFKRSGKFSTWLYKIIYNTALTSLRGNKISLSSMEEFQSDELNIPDNYDNGFEKLSKNDQVNYINKAIAKLDETDNLMITLYYTCECTILEVGAITGWNTSTIKVRLHRARQKLYKELSMLLIKEMNDLL
ncbi:MAG: sigma-70 family RNA polymerase sigma factor [Bacteroidota bacterium]